MKHNSSIKRNTKQVIFLFFLILSALVILSICPIQQTQQNNDVIESTIKTEEITQTVDAKKTVVTIPESIPILMYHHIRDYSNNNDKIGENLSVSPANLANQLDYLEQKGYTPITFHDLDSEFLPEKPIILTFDDGYDNFYSNAVPLLQSRKMKAVVYIIADKTNTNGYMTEEEIKETSSIGVEIASHTLTHPDLTKISIEKATKELTESKAKIESITNINIISFCYPAGKFNRDIEQLVANSGYKYATTTVSGMANLKINTYALNRYRVNKDTNIKNIIK